MSDVPTSAGPKLAVEVDHYAIAEAPPLERPSALRRVWARFHAASPFASNVALTMGANVVLGVVGLITGPICARLLGPSGRGELAAIQNLYWLAATLAMLGVPEATLYFTARRERESRRILASGIVLVLLVYPVFYLSAYFLAPHFLAAQSHVVIQTARWVLLGLPLYALLTIPLFSLRGNNDLVRWNLMRLVPAIGWFALLVALFFAGAPTPRNVAFGYLGVLAAGLIPTVWVVRRRTSGSSSPQPELWPKLLRYGLPLALAEIPLTLNLRLDQMLMAAFLPARLLGLYVVAVAWGNTVPPLLYAIGTVLFPRVARADASDRPALLAQGVRIGIFAALILAVFLAAVTPFTVPLLFGRAFQESVAVAVVLVFASAICGVNVVLEEGLRGLGETSSVFLGEIAGLAVTLLGLIALLRPFGIFGAGVASFLGYLGTTIALLFRIRMKLHIRFADLVIPRSRELKEAWGRCVSLKRGFLNAQD